MLKSQGMTPGFFLVGALAFMRGKERFSAPTKVGFWSRALAPEIGKLKAETHLKLSAFSLE
jgi:hypothetical protein